MHHADNTPQLPTRVVDVGPSDGREEPRLKITSGACALYATLSHCWGKHQIITTTKANLHQHCKIIHFGDLSKTFQDAVDITRALGFRYLWIDSLCIVQDDTEDWKRESVSMGSIYQGAAITIAASWAKDGRDGCFKPRSSSAPCVRLPYTVDGEAMPGEFVYAGLFPDAAVSDLDGSPLGKRAWITQEWMLSPRTIHYTEARLVWACRTTLEGEDGEVIAQMHEQRLLDSVRRFRLREGEPSEEQSPSEENSVLGFFANWCELVNTYTSRQLTYESDKPIAILGLAKEISQGIQAECTAGIFYERDQCRPATRTPETTAPPGPLGIGIPRAFASIEDQCTIIQLFCFGKVDLTRPMALRHLPSWSWTSTMGEVIYHTPAQTARPIACHIRINDTSSLEAYLGSNATLVLDAWIKPLQLGKYVVKHTDIRSSKWPMDKPFYEFHSQSTFMSGAAMVAQKSYCIAHTDSKAVGWMSIDSGMAPPERGSFAICLSINDRNGVFDGFNVIIVAEREGVGKVPERGFVRLGVGEIVEDGWFDGASLERILLE